MFDVYIKNYMNGSTKVTSETKMLTIPVVSDDPQYLNKPMVKLDWSSTGTFDFEVEPKSQFYNSFIHLRTIIRVDYDGDTIFRGRVLTISNTLWGTRKIKCEDQYGFFRDGQHEGVADEKRPVINLSTYIRGLIDDYNRQMADDPDKKFYVGEIPGNYSASIAEDQKCPDITEKFGSSSWQEVKACLDDVGSGYGGHWRVRYTGGKAYLDLLKNYFRATVNSQAIELSKNILDLNNDYQVDNIFTIVIPLGASESKTSNGNTTTTVTTTISGYNTDLHEGNYIKVPDLVNIFTPAKLNSGYHTLEDYRDAIDKYGTIFKTVSFSNADSPALLWSYATDWIKNNYLGVVRDFSIKVVDFHQLSQTPTYSEHASTQKYMVGDRVRVIYPVFINGEKQMRTEIMTIKGISYDLYNPENTMLTIGIPSDLLDHEYGQKKTKAKKTKGDNTTAPVPSGGGGGGRKTINVHKWIRGTISNYDWGDATLISRASYSYDKSHPLISVYAMSTYKLAEYVAKDKKTYWVCVSRLGFFVCDPSQNYRIFKWIAFTDKDNKINIQGVEFDLDTQLAALLKVCEHDDNVEVDLDYKASVGPGGTTIVHEPDGSVTMSVVKNVRVHYSVKEAIYKLGIYGNRTQIYSTYSVIYPGQSTGTGFKRIAKFKASNGADIYVLMADAGIGVSVNGSSVDRWLFQTDSDGKLTIGGFTFDMNKPAEKAALEAAAATDTEAKVTIESNGSISIAPASDTPSGETAGQPVIELNPIGGTAGFGRKEDGSWFIKLNDEVTYTDKDGNVVTKKGFVTAEDFNLPEIPSFKTKLAVIDEAIIARLTVGEFNAYQVNVNSKFNDVERDLQDKGYSITKLNSDINLINADLTEKEAELLQHASDIAGHTVKLTKIDSDITAINADITDVEADLLAQGKKITKINSDIVTINSDITKAEADILTNAEKIGQHSIKITKIGSDITTINSNITEIDGELLAQGKKITKIGSDVTVIGGNLTEAQRDIAKNGQSITAINSDVVSITGRLDVNEANIRTLKTEKLSTTSLSSAFTNLGTASINKLTANELYVKPFDSMGAVSVANAFTNMRVQPSGTDYIIQALRFNSTSWEDLGTFSRATSLKGTWSGSVLSIKASPQGNVFKVGMGNVTADVHLGVETGTASVYKNSEGVENKNIISLPLYVNSTEKNSQGIETQTRRYAPSPATVYITDLRETKSITSNGTYTPSDKKLGFSSVSVNITSSIDGSWSGKTYTVTSNPGSKKKTIGFAGTEDVVLSITHDANATIYKNSSGVENKNYVQIQAYAKSIETDSQGAETETTRYTPSKSTIGISNLMETKSISSDGTYTPSEGKIGFSSITVDAWANGFNAVSSPSVTFTGLDGTTLSGVSGKATISNKTDGTGRSTSFSLSMEKTTYTPSASVGAKDCVVVKTSGGTVVGRIDTSTTVTITSDNNSDTRTSFNGKVYAGKDSKTMYMTTGSWSGGEAPASVRLGNSSGNLISRIMIDAPKPSGIRYSSDYSTSGSTNLATYTAKNLTKTYLYFTVGGKKYHITMN